jgi:cobalamin synthase
MQTMRRNRLYWATPLLGVFIGLAYLVAFWLGGRPGDGVLGLLVMLAFTGALMLLGRRSETVQGLLDHRDERITGMDLKATAVTAVAMIVAVLVGFVVDIARGGSGEPFAAIGAIGGLAYLGALLFFRLRR